MFVLKLFSLEVLLPTTVQTEVIHVTKDVDNIVGPFDTVDNSRLKCYSVL